MPSKAEPHSTGTARLWIVASRSTRWISAAGTGSSASINSVSSSLYIESWSSICPRHSSASSCSSAGISATTISAPLLSPVEGEHPHGHQVDQAAEGFFDVRRAGADGQIDGDRLAVQPVADFVERAEEVGPFAVHLVDKRDPRHAVLVGLMPDGFALGLDAFAGAEDHHAAVEHPQAPLHLGGEIDVAGRVDQVDLDVLPGEGDRRRR